MSTDSPHSTESRAATSPLVEAVREQLESAKEPWVELAPTTFISSGVPMGMEFAQATLTLDEASESCSFVVDLNLRIPQDRHREAARFLHKINRALPRRGFELGDDGWVRFVGEGQLKPLLGSDVAGAVREALLRSAVMINDLYALTAGAHAWELEGKTFEPDAHLAEPSDPTQVGDEALDDDGDPGDADDEDIATLISRLLH